MTLADILKPTATVIVHAQVKGIQIGGGIGVLTAIPCLLLQPSLLNKRNDPPLVAVANIAFAGVVLGGVTASLSCLHKISKLSKAGIIERAEKVSTDKEWQKVVASSGAGEIAGFGIALARVVGTAKREGKCVFGLTFRKETAWDMIVFGTVGIAVGAGVYRFGKFVCEKFETGKGGQVCEVDEGDVGVERTGKETVDSVVDGKMSEEEMTKEE